jgi:hypothetical protein
MTSVTVSALTGAVIEDLSPEDALVRQRAAMKCTAAQARLAMLDAGILGDVQAIIAASGDTALQIAWEYGTEWRRGDPRIMALAGAAGLDDTQIDALFARAIAL